MAFFSNANLLSFLWNIYTPMVEKQPLADLIRHVCYSICFDFVTADIPYNAYVERRDRNRVTTVMTNAACKGM